MAGKKITAPTSTRGRQTSFSFMSRGTLVYFGTLKTRNKNTVKKK